MSVPPAESDALRAVAAELEQEGWRVALMPPADVLPAPLRSFEPDLVATKDGDNLIVEVKGKATLRRNPGIISWVERMSTTINELPGWSFRLVWVGDDLQQPASAPTAVRRAREAAAVATISAEAGLLLGWSAVETALNAALEPTGSRIAGHRQRPRAGRRLLETAFDANLLDGHSMDFLVRVERLRSLVAHGLESSDVEGGLVSRLVEWLLGFLGASAAGAESVVPPD